jgi:hypothetical protein
MQTLTLYEDGLKYFVTWLLEDESAARFPAFDCEDVDLALDLAVDALLPAVTS